jgi:hypothetical protein
MPIFLNFFDEIKNLKSFLLLHSNKNSSYNVP